MGIHVLIIDELGDCTNGGESASAKGFTVTNCEGTFRTL